MIRRVLFTGEAFLTKKQHTRLEALCADPAHADVWRAWRVYQQVGAAYREQFSGTGRRRMRELIDTVKTTTPARFAELRKLAYSLDRRRVDILAYFDHPRTSNGPTEAINGRLEHLRGSALGSGTWRTTSRDRCWNRAGSDRFYTLKREEPVNASWQISRG